jgi:hypothetical protein
MESCTDEGWVVKYGGSLLLDDDFDFSVDAFQIPEDFSSGYK